MGPCCTTLVIGGSRPVVEVFVLGVGPVVRNARERARLVRPMTVLEPGEAGTQMLGDAEPQAEFLGGFLPVADYVAVRAHLHGVPFVVRRVPEFEVVVMHAHADEIAGSGLLVESHQPVRVPLLGLPERDQILVTQLGRVTVVFQVILVLCSALLIKLPGIPVTEHGNRLRAPVSPHAQLGITKPVRILIMLQRSRGGLKRSRGDRQLVLANRLVRPCRHCGDAPDSQRTDE